MLQVVGSKVDFSTVLYYQEGDLSVLSNDSLYWSMSLVCTLPHFDEDVISLQHPYPNGAHSVIGSVALLLPSHLPNGPQWH